MTERSHGIILRTRPFTETSLIVQWLTPDFGRLSTVARGARRAKSPFAGKLDLFYSGEFSFARNRRSDLHTLAEVSLRETHAALRRELGYLQQAAYCATLIEQTTEKETPLPVIFDLLREFLAALPAAPPRQQSVLAFELKLLLELGLTPDLEKTRLTGGTRRIIKTLASADWTVIQRLQLAPAQTAELRGFLHDFLTFHLEKIPKGRGAALIQRSGNDHPK
jgi:DNA repair protein RecO (recombination protein O)